MVTGLKKLENDISSGEINEVIKKYEITLGDYLFIRLLSKLNLIQNYAVRQLS